MARDVMPWSARISRISSDRRTKTRTGSSCTRTSHKILKKIQEVTIANPWLQLPIHVPKLALVARDPDTPQGNVT